MHQESPCSDIFRKRATKPLLKQKQRQKHLTWAKEKKTELSNEFNQVLSGPKSSLQMKVNFAFHLEIKVWSMEEDSKLFEVQCEVSTVSDDLGCHAVCWCWSIVFYQVQSQRNRLPGDFGALYAFHLRTSFMEMLISFSSRTLAPAHSAKTTLK